MGPGTLLGPAYGDVHAILHFALGSKRLPHNFHKCTARLGAPLFCMSLYASKRKIFFRLGAGQRVRSQPGVRSARAYSPSA